MGARQGAEIQNEAESVHRPRKWQRRPATVVRGCEYRAAELCVSSSAKYRITRTAEQDRDKLAVSFHAKALAVKTF
jgi:hypothetical protein